MSHFEKVKAFHQKFGLPVGATPQFVPWALVPSWRGFTVLRCLHDIEAGLKSARQENDVIWGRIQMMVEELREFTEAVIELDGAEPSEEFLLLSKMADALVDLEYFILGTAAMMGLPYDQIFDAVHEANMKKERVASSEESKRLNKLDVKKPEGWSPPDVRGIIENNLPDKNSEPMSGTPCS